MRVVVYITGDPLGWNLVRESNEPPSDEDAEWLPFGKNGWLDVEGYQEYKDDPSIDIRTRIDWKRHYAKDVIDELMTNYPKISGFWFDGWGETGGAEAAANVEVFQFIHSRMPDAVNIKNNSSQGRVVMPGEDDASDDAEGIGEQERGLEDADEDHDRRCEEAVRELDRGRDALDPGEEPPVAMRPVLAASEPGLRGAHEPADGDEPEGRCGGRDRELLEAGHVSPMARRPACPRRMIPEGGVGR